MLFAGCGASEESKPTESKAPESISEASESSSEAISSESAPESKPAAQLREEKATVTNINTDANALSAFSKELAETEFPYETMDEIFDFAGSKQYFSENIKPVTAHRYSGFIKDGKVDEAALLSHVKENNAAFDPHKHPGALFYKEIEDSKMLSQVISYIAEGVEAELPYKSAEEIATLDCVLGDLCIFQDAGLSAAAVTEENILTINEPMVNMMAINSGTENGLRHTIVHESKHLLQTSCNDYKVSSAQPLGLGIRYEKGKKNPYGWTWFLESGAERNTVLQLGDEAQTYKHMIGYLETLDFAGILSDYAEDGFDITKKSVTQDRAAAFRILGADLGVSEEEIVKLMLSMEIIQNRVEEYPDFYKEAFGKELSEQEVKSFRVSLRPTFLLNASKIYYLNLAEALKKAENPILEDVFYLLSLWEADLNYHTDYIDGTPSGKTLEFMQAYDEIQQKLFEAVASSGDLTIEEINKRFCAYSPFVKDENNVEVPNCQLSWLKQAKKDWLLNKAKGERMRFVPAMELLLPQK